MALRNYQNALISSGQGVRVDDLTSQLRIDAVVVDFIQVGDTFYLRLEGEEGEFYGTSDISPELKWARPGIRVVAIVQQGELRSKQLYGFDIPALDVSELGNPQ